MKYLYIRKQWVNLIPILLEIGIDKKAIHLVVINPAIMFLYNDNDRSDECLIECNDPELLTFIKLKVNCIEVPEPLAIRLIKNEIVLTNSDSNFIKSWNIYIEAVMDMI